MKRFESGETAYTLNGEEVFVVRDIEDGYLGKPVYLEDGEVWHGEPRIFKDLYSSVPVQKFEAEVLKLKEERQRIADEVQKLKQEKRKAHEEVREAERTLRQHRGMAELDPSIRDFLKIVNRDKSVLFVGDHGKSNRTRKILTIEQLKNVKAEVRFSNSRYPSDNHKSLSIRAEYREDHWSDCSVYVQCFATEEEALNHLQGWIFSDNGDSSGEILDAKESTAKKYGLVFPECKRKDQKQKEYESLLSRIEKDAVRLTELRTQAESLYSQVLALGGDQ